MNAVTNALLVREPLTSQVGFAAISMVRPTERTRPTMTWHIDNANGRPVIGWVRLPAVPVTIAAGA
jgi:hypothetical protein